ncbi:MAG: hypothetical protein KF775_14695 [Cyclobacteriaceae bacterium]|nr:hypothetical protein [Cyclobacteriaceae bacterium]
MIDKFKSYQLSNGKMKAISGGVGRLCSVQCTNSVGAWTGYYESSAQLGNAISTWCASGTGTYQCAKALA